MTKQVEVIAVEAGHDGRVYRAAGERFHVPEDRLADGTTWFVRVEEAPPPKPVVKNARPPGAGPARGSAVNADPNETPGAGPDAAQ